MRKSDASEVAELHRQGIDTGFLSSLGKRFLVQLYKAIPSSPSGFGHVYRETGQPVRGFIACSSSTGSLYREALLRRGLLMALPLARHLVRPSVVKRMLHTLRYPKQTAELPSAEILSIAVSAEARGLGVGKKLMAAALETFRTRGIEQVRVAVWAGNDRANQFYRSCGFTLSLQTEHHGLPMNIYTIDT
ncbi:MAG: GNAT family N-acetyltransferase [Phycisphaerae bacterium]